MMPSPIQVAMKTVCFGSIAVLSACSLAADQDAEQQQDNEMPVVDVRHTDVERQAIGNCWIYATASWTESLHKASTGTDLDVSQSYWTYLHWFDQLTSSAELPTENGKQEISTGGSWSEARRIIQKYGMMAEADFIADDSEQEQSHRQSSALAAMFGPGLERTLRGGATVQGTAVVPASGISAKYPVGPNARSVAAPSAQTLSTALTEWRQVYYSDNAAARRDSLKRVQAALHGSAPVVVSWLVDFNALESSPSSPLYGSFNLQTLEAAGSPGRQGGHLTVLEDYEVLVPSQWTRSNQHGDLNKGEWAHYGPYPVDAAVPV
ncbi:MAG: hypothetical protein MUF54_18485, partial [Polyangiaceae bacterium]|nr:hypothetical protein [Polyangiaceae bacterium]